MERTKESTALATYEKGDVTVGHARSAIVADWVGL